MSAGAVSLAVGNFQYRSLITQRRPGGTQQRRKGNLGAIGMQCVPTAQSAPPTAPYQQSLEDKLNSIGSHDILPELLSIKSEE